MQQPESIPQPPSLLDYLLVIAKHKKMIFFTTFAAAVITAIITLIMPNIYTARTMIIPSDDDKGAMGALMAQMGGLAGLTGGAIGAKSAGDLYVTMLKSETLKDPIVDQFKLLELYKVKFRADAYSKLDKNTIITLGKKDGVIVVKVDDKDPKRAADMANAYVEELGKLTSKLNMTGAGNNRIFLEKRIAEAKTDLNHAEEVLKNFQSRNKAISVSDQAQATISGVAQLRGQLAVKEVELVTLQQKFTDTSQEVKSAKSAISGLRSQIATLEGKANGSSSIPSVGNMPQLGQDYLKIMRDFKIQESVLEMLTKQYEAVRINETKDVAPFQILQKAKKPEKKSKPARRSILMQTTSIVFLSMCLLLIARDKFVKMTIEEKAKWVQLIK